MVNRTNQLQPANRISGIKPYFYVNLNKQISYLKEKSIDVIRVDMGNPDLPPSKKIVNHMIHETRKSTTHGYSPIGGGNDFKAAISNYYKNRFDVTIDPSREAIGLIGSKEGLFNICQAILNPGDVALIPDPSYPVYTSGSKIAGAEIYKIPLLEKNDFLPEISAIPSNIIKRTKILWLNYPNNPTGATAPPDYFKEIVEFALRHKLIIIHDAAYTEVFYDGAVLPSSILKVEGAKECCVEFNSLSKSFNMAGWRLGMAVGNESLLQLLNTYKSQVDSSNFHPIISAGIMALEYDRKWIEQRNTTYKLRRDIICKSLNGLGFSLRKPSAGMYIWAKKSDLFTDSIDFCHKLLNETGVSFTPGIIFGEMGEGYIRLSIGTNTKKLIEALKRINQWLN